MEYEPELNVGSVVEVTVICKIQSVVTAAAPDEL
jgi:hypothetical protein